MRAIIGPAEKEERYEESQLPTGILATCLRPAGRILDILELGAKILRKKAKTTAVK